MASSSSTDSTPPRKYQVFLSFRGEDTRNTFVGHLYTALVQKGIVTYKDDHNLEKGQSISPELMKAIEDSKFAIIIFSKNYASSTWCLDELVKIMECETEHAQSVIPIFYDVDPSDVRNQKNSFAESFAKHELNFKDNMKKVQVWKQALKQAANITGEDIRGKNEASRIKEIVEDIFWKLHPKPFSTKGLVGIESRMTKLDSLLLKDPNGVCFVGILGMGGIGKTTISRVIFEKYIGRFQGGCFLREVSKGRIVDLQNILLSKVLNLESGKVITDENEDSRMIEERFCSKTVLVVLDDVNDLDQLTSLAAEREWFGSGSRIVITTRDEHLLTDVNETYKVDLLSDDEAMHLFCLHAFKQSHPAQGFFQLSKRVVSYAGGLPLALKILGSHLRGRRSDVWESALDRLKDAPERKIFGVLKISFDRLSDIQKETFLDIACFFRKRGEDDVKKILHICGFHPGESIPVLIERSFIHISDGKIEMHDLIEEMGQNIVRQEANNKPERYRRLWDPKDISKVLTSNTDTAEVEALVLQQVGENEIGTHKGVFKKMNKLRLLEILHCTFTSDYLPNTLWWLRWWGYPGKYLPKDFRPINLVHLDLSWSSIVETPDVSGMPNLEVLDLEDCHNLLEVHPSIGVHKKLVRLVLSFCSNLEKFPRIIQMESLEILYLCRCSKLHSIPEIHSKTSRLRILYLTGMKIEELPWSFGGLTSLQELHLSSCEDLLGLPSSLCGLQHLEVISMGDCKMLEALPELPLSIKQLSLNYCTALTRIPSLVDLLGKFKGLHRLLLLGCEQLVKKPKTSATIIMEDLNVSLHYNQETNDRPRTDALQQRIPQFLLAFWDWRSVSNALCTKREVVLVTLPWIEIPDWLYPSRWAQVTLTLSPSWYNDKFRGFALCANADDFYFKLHTCDGLVYDFLSNHTSSNESTGFCYVPISKITRDREWKYEKDSFLFEVTNLRGHVHTSWGMGLVYEGEVDEDISHLTIMNHYSPMNKGERPRLKVCVAARNHEEKEVVPAIGQHTYF